MSFYLLILRYGLIMVLLYIFADKDLRIEIHYLSYSELLNITTNFLIKTDLISEIDFTGRLT